MEIILTSILAFASTNIDDLFILTLFFGDKRYKPIDIYLGQYLGIIVLIAISVTGSLIGNFIDSKHRHPGAIPDLPGRTANHRFG